MKRSATLPTESSNETTAIFAVDAALEKFNLCTLLRGEVIEIEAANRTDVVEQRLGELRQRAVKCGYSELLLLCEPSGGCEQVVMRSALRLGFKTAWVSGEAVSKFRGV